MPEIRDLGKRPREDSESAGPSDRSKRKHEEGPTSTGFGSGPAGRDHLRFTGTAFPSAQPQETHHRSQAVLEGLDQQIVQMQQQAGSGEVPVSASHDGYHQQDTRALQTSLHPPARNEQSILQHQQEEVFDIHDYLNLSSDSDHESDQRDLLEAHGPKGVAPILSSTSHSYDSPFQKYPLVNLRQQDQIEQQQGTIGHHHDSHDQAETSIKEKDKQYLIGLLEKLINQRLGIKRFVEMLDQNKINNKEVLLFYRDYILKKYNNREFSYQLADKYDTVLRYTNELLMEYHGIKTYYDN